MADALLERCVRLTMRCPISTVGYDRLDEDSAERIARMILRQAVPDENVRAVMGKLAKRSEVGLAKYGVTTEQATQPAQYWLNHLQEELMDAAVYVERLMTELSE